MTGGLDSARRGLASADEEVRRAAIAELLVEPSEMDGGLLLLIEAMGDTSWRVRKEAAARAGAWPDRGQAAQALTIALAEPENVGRRNAVVEALVAVGAEAVAPLQASLAGRPEHRKVILDALGMIGDRRAAPSLVPLVDDLDLNVRVAAVEALGSVGGSEAEAALRRALAAGDKLLALAALDGLNRLRARVPEGVLEPLLAQPTLRAAALEALGVSGGQTAVAPLAAALADPVRSTREAAIRGLSNLAAPLDRAARAAVRAAFALSTGGMQSLVQALLEGTLGVQRAAAAVLGLSGRLEAVRPLALALADTDLREDALAALVAIGPHAVDGLVALAPDLEGRLRSDVYRLLPRLGPQAVDPRVRAFLAEALVDEDVEAAGGAAQALGELGGRESLPPLARALERGGEVARAAAAALGQLGGSHYDEVRMLVQTRGLEGPAAPHLCRVLGACGRVEDVPVLRAALGASSAAVRRAAAEALAQLPGTHEGDDALLFALADESAEVRAAAARALGAHAGPSSGRVIDSLSRAARDGEVAVRGAAARALGQVANAGAAPDRARARVLVRELAEGADSIAAVPALEALGDLKDPADDARLMAALDSTDVEIVKMAARALGRRASASGSGPAREALNRALSDRRWDVRRAAAQALGEHGPVAHPLLFARRTVERDALVLDAIDLALGRAPQARAE